jgi:hypothetical protein
MTKPIDCSNFSRPESEGEESTGTGERMDVAPTDREQELARMEQVKAIQHQTQQQRAEMVGAGYPPHPQMGRQTRPYVWSDGQARMPMSNRNTLPLPLKR